jgi:ectoine hydroxylase-related dioxygenase (phytanoyl-CoA dioxygenase family)
MNATRLDNISDEDVQSFQRDGAICLRGVFDEHWVNRVAAGVERNLAEPSPYAKHYTPKGNPGFFFGDYCNWSRIPEFREFVLHSPAASIAGHVMRSHRVRIFHDHLLVKEPGTTERTPWHHDQPYYCVDGEQVCSIWMPLDPVSRDVSIEYVAGSHRGEWYMPRRFVDMRDYDYQPGAYPSVPDVDGERDKYTILSWDLEPGDCIVFHALTLHGAPGNLSRQRRRALSTRWLGDDVVYAKRPGATSPPFPELDGTLQPGDPMDHELFPIVWRREG